MYGASELGDFSLLWHMVGLARGLTSDERADEAIRLSVILAGESLLVNGVIKSFFRRRRPMWEQPRAFRIRRPRSSSFPSGHASAAFTAATDPERGQPAVAAVLHGRRRRGVEPDVRQDPPRLRRRRRHRDRAGHRPRRQESMAETRNVLVLDVLEVT